MLGTDKTIYHTSESGEILSAPNSNRNASIKTITKDKKGNLWVGNFRSAFSIKKSNINKSSSVLEFTSIVPIRTYSLHCDFDENVWIGSTKGMFKYHEEVVKPFLQNRKHEIFHYTDIIQSHYDSSIWASTQGDGLLQIKNDTVINHFKKGNKLISDICNEIFLGEQNYLWLATNKGIQKLRLTDMSSDIVNKYDGLPTDEITNIAVSNNIVYAGSSKGIVTFSANSDNINTLPPPIHITNFSIFEKDTTLYDFYDLKYNQNSIQIDFVGLGYKARGNILYKYRMLGIDTNWVTTDTRFARFPGMNNGDYEFQVLAINEDGIESESPEIIKICVTPPYWKTLWFRAFVLLAIIGLVGGFFNFRDKTIRRRERMETDFKLQLNDLRAQALQTQMNPHFIFNSMNAIQHFLTKEDKENAMIYLARFAKLIRFIFDHSRQKTISLQKELEFLNLYLILEKIRFENKIKVTFEVDSTIAGKEDDIHLPPLLIQPIVENAFKHGLFHKKEKGHLKINFSYEKQMLSCIIEDDGVGRKKTTELNQWRKNRHKSSGIKSTKERISLLLSLIHISEPTRPY